MARIFSTINTDKIKVEKTACGYNEAWGRVNWGSASESHCCMYYRVAWQKTSEKPSIQLDIKDVAKVSINGTLYNVAEDGSLVLSVIPGSN